MPKVDFERSVHGPVTALKWASRARGSGMLIAGTGEGWLYAFASDDTVRLSS
jgi:hypothetical protein